MGTWKFQRKGGSCLQEQVQWGPRSCGRSHVGGLALGPESGRVACRVHEWVCASELCVRSGLGTVPGNSCFAESYRVVLCDPLSVKLPRCLPNHGRSDLLPREAEAEAQRIQ